MGMSDSSTWSCKGAEVGCGLVAQLIGGGADALPRDVGVFISRSTKALVREGRGFVENIYFSSTRCILGMRGRKKEAFVCIPTELSLNSG